MNDIRHYALLIEEDLYVGTYEFASAEERDRITTAYAEDPAHEDDIGNVPVFEYLDVIDGSIVGVGMWDGKTYA